MNQKKSIVVSMRLSADELARCEALLARMAIPSLKLSGFLHDKLMAKVAEDSRECAPKKGARK
jgi:hypothetical protein